MLGFYFFFEQTNTTLQQKFPNIFKTNTTLKNRHAMEHMEIIKSYGWLNTLYEIAKQGVFTKHPHNAVDSVRNENMNVIFTYLSWKTAHAEYESAVKESMHKEALAKAKAKRRNNKR